MTPAFTRNRRPTKPGTYAAQLDGPDGTKVAVTLTAEPNGRSLKYTLTRDEDGYVINTLTREYRTTHGRLGWYSTFHTKPWENFHGASDPAGVWYCWLDSAMWRVKNGKVTREQWAAHVAWGKAIQADRERERATWEARNPSR